MANQQQYPQSRQLQYYEQWRSQQGHEQHGQHAQHDYGYDNAYYEQQGYDYDGGWDHGYYEQQGNWHEGAQQHGYADAAYHNQQYAEPQPHRQDPRNRPSNRSNAPPQHAPPARNGLRPPGLDRSLLNPVQPKSLPQDNPFPTFPSQKNKEPTSTADITQGMSQMAVKDGGSRERSREQPSQSGMPAPRQHREQQQRAPPQQRSEGSSRQDSGHFEGHGRNRRPPPTRVPSDQRPAPMDLQKARGPPPQRLSDPKSPSRRAFGPNTQRSATMPQNLPSDARGSGRGQYQDHQQQRAEPGTVDGYHGPVSNDYVPPRPSTAGGSRNNAAQDWHEPRPPMPQVPPQSTHQQEQTYRQDQHAHEEEHGVLDNFYDDYYDDAKDRKSMASTLDMPNFDAIPETNNKHRRGDSIDNHLSPSSGSAHAQQGMRQGFPGSNGPNPGGKVQSQASRSRSQPDLYEGYAQDAYETASDAPPMPGLPRANTGFAPVHGYPPGRGPPARAMTFNDANSGSYDATYSQGYHNQQRSNFDPRYGRQPPPAQRMYSDDSAYSEPPPTTARNGPTPFGPGQPIVRPGTAAPAPGRMPSDPMGRRPGTAQPSSNPNALPAHPQPVRPGLMSQNQQQQFQQPQVAQQARPPPVRQYNSEPGRASYDSGQPGPQRQSVTSHPVTYDELNRLRNTMKSNPSDIATGLKLAKKLVEAASVLSDEGGTADTRTKNKNREKFILEAHKIIKKLVSAGSPDAMFYLADCYGQGLLGLQVDTKEAFNLYQSAAKGGHAASAYRTAVCCEMGHEEGGGTKRDPLKAVQWYRRAAALGDSPALYKMGMILLKGLLGQQRNFGEAINMLKRAAERADRDNPHALHELALIYESQTGNERIIPDEAYALQLFHQAADLGYKFSQFRLGQAYEYGLLGCNIDARTSIAWYTKAAAQEEHQSELALSGWYLTGTSGILEQSDTEAYLWARKAACAEPPLPKALFAMGYFTEVGIGCPRSLDEAKRWYGRAAAYKFPKAQERLEELKRGGSKAQMKRERLSRTNQKQQEENCTVM